MEADVISYWEDQTTDIESATRAVFSEGDIEVHSATDAATIVSLLGRSLPAGGLVDLGCGVGRLTGRVADLTGRDVRGIDPAPGMIRLAQAHNPHPLVTYDSSFDVQPMAGGFSMLVFQHLPALTVRTYLAWVAKCLIPGGAFVLQFVEGDYHVEHDHRYSEGWMVTMAKRVGLVSSVVFNDARHPEWRWVTVVKP